MARSSRRSRRLGAFATLIACLASATASAHRRDEYLQAARLAVEPGRVEIEIDLTPGIAVAAAVAADIDRDRNQEISADEGRVYASAVLRATALDIDGVPLSVELVDHAFPAVDAMMKGVGTARIRAMAAMPPLGDGRHSLRFRNRHRTDIGAYLANALVPANERVRIEAQRRTVDQREVIVDYTLHADVATRMRRGMLVGFSGLVLLGLSWRRCRR